jgi:tRNA(Ile)-lysidine synthase
VRPDEDTLLAVCHFPPPGAAVDLAVSGGPDSLGLLQLALAGALAVTVHHVDHHVRPTSTDDAHVVAAVCEGLGVPFVLHDVRIAAGGNFESRARSARRGAMPASVMTGHTMDDLVETLLLNMLRGAGVDGLSPMVGDPTKPLRDVRRGVLHDYVHSSSLRPRVDETNESPAFRRNRVRHELLPVMRNVAERDVVPLLARQAALMHEERVWLDQLSLDDVAVVLAKADCRELRRWPTARLRRWLRVELRTLDQGDGDHPPSADEVERAISVVRGEAVATELGGGRRLARRGQRLTLTKARPLR